MAAYLWTPQPLYSGDIFLKMDLQYFYMQRFSNKYYSNVFPTLQKSKNSHSHIAFVFIGKLFSQHPVSGQMTAGATSTPEVQQWRKPKTRQDMCPKCIATNLNTSHAQCYSWLKSLSCNYYPLKILPIRNYLPLWQLISYFVLLWLPTSRPWVNMVLAFYFIHFSYNFLRSIFTFQFCIDINK